MSPSSHSISETLQAAQASLAHLAYGSPRLEAELLLCEALGKPRSHLFAWPERRMAPEEQERLQLLLQRRMSGEPVAYILGRREFWSLELEVTSDTLIPRPETELLVERALARIPREVAWTVADLGTGSGAVAAAVASERPRCLILATDSSSAALVVAQRNFSRLGLGGASGANDASSLGQGEVRLLLGSWCEALPAELRCDLIMSNPPYIPEGDAHLTAGDLPWEPRSALASGEDGLRDIRCIVNESLSHLRPGGWLMFEHGYDQEAAVGDTLSRAGFRSVATYRDGAGQPRVTEGQLPASPDSG